MNVMLCFLPQKKKEKGNCYLPLPLPSLYWWVKWSPEKVTNSFKVTQLTEAESGPEPNSDHSCWGWEWEGAVGGRVGDGTFHDIVFSMPGTELEEKTACLI